MGKAMTPWSGKKSSETPFGMRLKAARKMAGLSMEDLAKRLGGIVTKQAIGKYEQGKMMPTADVLEKLVTVLNIATWGASPLRSIETEAADILRCETPDLVEMEGSISPRFRRAGFLARLLRKGEEPAGAKSAGETSRHYLAVHLERLGEAEKPVRDEAVKTDLLREEIPLAARVEGFPALASRRAQYLHAWESNASLDMIKFREGGRLSAKMESALRYRIADYLMRYLQLESVLGSAEAFENPAAGLPVRTLEEVEAAAVEVRKRWELGTGPIVNLLALLEDKGIKVYEARGIEEFDGLSGRFGTFQFIAVSVECPADRIRFTAAHELGHVLCDFSAREDPESECHTFGAAFLLPRTAMEKAFRPSRRKVTMGDLGEIKETYGVSLQAIMYRAHGLGLVSDRQLRSFRETLKEKDWVVEEPVAYSGKEQATRFRRLLHYAVAADILDVGRAAEMAGVPAEELKKEIGDIF
jgi:Zn-dependent peptidase ImmA (M78 family)/transcriptional regulator with XRE-family HTH domain